jgi:hypothetical protein
MKDIQEIQKNSLSNYYYDIFSPSKNWMVTDKGTVHDYISGYYTDEFDDRDKEIKIVEIGIACGCSIELWKSWFTNADIYSFDINLCGDSKVQIEGVTLLYQDAYDRNTVDMFLDESLDYVIDDGPHNLQSQKDTILLYLPKLKKDGKIIIEDVQSIDWIEEFIKLINDHSLNVEYKTFDLRSNKDRYDDIIFEVTKK